MQTKAKTFAELSATGPYISYELAPKLQKQQKQTNKTPLPLSKEGWGRVYHYS